MRDANSVAQSAKFSTAPCKLPVVVFTSRYDEVTQIITDELFIFFIIFSNSCTKKRSTLRNRVWISVGNLGTFCRRQEKISCRLHKSPVLLCCHSFLLPSMYGVLAHYYSFISSPSVMANFKHHNAVQLLCARTRDGTAGWERLTHHASYHANYGAYAVLMATSQRKSLVLHRYSAVTAVALQLMPVEMLRKLDQSDWVRGAWIVSETFPTSDPKGFWSDDDSSMGGSEDWWWEPDKKDDREIQNCHCRISLDSW